ncbi:MarR family winged helix-turn-helix transcriptional regulator [Paenibacillus hexagrammi]|uniref:MarR family transcriptional regulator n=1 Tax=Paenibacillus hexagrammi TaxID=2908839 RepID=A0ABY3SKR3_9BACL|nr:MarR family transcriptional regulator [Paenibacillus sp. YPD9-1]UJF34457.1 MarR family transcriptional regulator [Paenibacillus sp. YPD9-1]
MNEAMSSYTERFRTAFDSTYRKLNQAVLSKLEFDITGPQYFMLFMIMKQGSAKQTQLAELMGVKPSAITVMIDRLVQSGYVVRKHHETDRRVVLVELTEDGRHVLQTAEQTHKEVAAQGLSQLSPEELDLFIRMMEKLATYY